MPFRPGQSGNPLGRHTGFVDFKSLINKSLNKAVSAEDKRTRAIALVDALTAQACDGKEWAIKEVLDRFLGKPTQSAKIEVEQRVVVEFALPAPPVRRVLSEEDGALKLPEDVLSKLVLGATEAESQGLAGSAEESAKDSLEITLDDH